MQLVPGLYMAIKLFFFSVSCLYNMAIEFFFFVPDTFSALRRLCCSLGGLSFEYFECSTKDLVHNVVSKSCLNYTSFEKTGGM